MTTFPAKFRGRCGTCRQKVDVGEPVTYDNERVVHVDCFSGLSEITERRDSIVCPACFMTTCDCEKE